MLRRPRRRFWGALLALKTDDYTVLLADAYYCLAYIALLLPHWMGHAGNQFDGGGWAAIPVGVKAVCGVCALMQARETRSTFPKAE
mmetsp:Transcript_5378/g.16571  ORF Transcript_5378/g.16571 Transcript_5378/m.16571 type:complete len:86 (+) Transcript_5378:406-663(+)